MDDDVQAKFDPQEETDKIHQSEQEKANNTEDEDNAAAEMAVDAEVGRQKNAGVINGDEVNSDVWELEDINEMQMATTEFIGGSYNVSGGWGEWKHEGEETWREWEFYPAYGHQENDWVIDGLWNFEDHHFPNLVNPDDAANPRDPQA